MGMRLRLTHLLLIVLLSPCVASSASDDARLLDYLRAQTSSASRLLTRVRVLCPREEFGEFRTLIERTEANAQSTDAMMESTRVAIETASGLLADGKPEESTELICSVVQQRAAAAGALDPRTFAAFNNLAVILRKGGRVAEAR